MLDIALHAGYVLFLYLALGLLTLVGFYGAGGQVTDKQGLGIMLVWPVVLLSKVWRGIVYLASAAHQGITYVREN